jgi:hypothetical protein
MDARLTGATTVWFGVHCSPPPRRNLMVRNVSVLVNTNFSVYYYILTFVKTVVWNFLKTFKNSQPHRQFVRPPFGFEL